MKKWFAKKIGFIIFSISMTGVYAGSATNECLANLQSHIISADTAWLDDCKLSDKDVPTIISYLGTHPEIKRLYLLNNNISDEGALLLAKNKTLTMLELRNNNVGSKGAIALAHSSIHMLDLKGNKFNSPNSVTVANNNVSISKLQQINHDVIILG